MSANAKESYIRQLQRTREFHLKAARAYESYNQRGNAEAARRAAAACDVAIARAEAK